MSAVPDGRFDELKDKVDDVADAVVDRSDDIVAPAGSAAEKVQAHPVYRGLVTAGLISYGVVHLLLALLVVQVIRGVGGDASEAGSIAMLAGVPFGFAALALVTAGMMALVVWQVLLALYGYGYLDGARLLRRKLASLGRAVVYLGLGVAAARVLWGAREDSNEATRSTSAALLSQWYGPLLVTIAGIMVVGVGLAMVKRGLTGSFAKHDLQSSVPWWAWWLGTVGWSMKGVTQVLVGALLLVASWRHDSREAGSLDLALKVIAAQPYGKVALVVVATGLAAFGVYCFPWAFNARHDASKD